MPFSKMIPLQKKTQEKDVFVFKKFYSLEIKNWLIIIHWLVTKTDSLKDFIYSKLGLDSPNGIHSECIFTEDWDSVTDD